MNPVRNIHEDPVAAPPTVLVVEDDVLVRLVVADHLRACGFDVVEADNADEAVRVLQAGIKVDIVFSDIQMPGSIDGFGLAQWIGRERPALKVILTSGAAANPRDSGPFLAKPYEHAEIERQIRALLATSSIPS